MEPIGSSVTWAIPRLRAWCSSTVYLVGPSRDARAESSLGASQTHTHHRRDTSARDGYDGVLRDDPLGAMGAGRDGHARDARLARERHVPFDARTICRTREPPFRQCSRDANEH